MAPLNAMVKSDFEEAMELHFWVPYHLTMAALPYLRRNTESRIVNISSMAAELQSLIWRLIAQARLP